MRGYTTWTAERLELIALEYPACTDLKGLAKRLGVTFVAMQVKAKQMHLKRDPAVVRMLGFHGTRLPDTSSIVSSALASAPDFVRAWGCVA